MKITLNKVLYLKLDEGISIVYQKLGLSLSHNLKSELDSKLRSELKEEYDKTR